MSLRTIIKHLPSNLNLLLLRSITTTSAHPPFLNHLPHQNQPKQQHPNVYSLMKQDPIEICADIWFKTFSNSTTQPFSNLTGFLNKFDLWVLGYQRSYAEETGSFPPRNAIHLNVLNDIFLLQKAVLNGQFRWGMKTQLFLMSPSDKQEPFVMSKSKLRALLESDKPTFQDRVVQEVLLFVMEPVFEPRFSTKSHAFRPGRNAHTVIRTIRSNFAGYLWFLKVNLSDILENVTPNVMMGCLEKVVKDKKVLKLIKSGLKAPARNQSKDESEHELKKKRKKKKVASKKKKILNEHEPKPDPYWLRTFYSFAPIEAANIPSYGHCGILSPLLANITLNEFDDWMKDKIVEFFRPSKLDSIWKENINDGSHNPAWPEFVPSCGREMTRKMDYIRHGAHVLVGIRGPREDAVEMRKDLIEFCEVKFGIGLDNSKVEVEHITRGIQFLDHIICLRVIHPTLHYTATGGKIVSEKGVGTLLSVTASLQQCIRQFRRLKFVKGDKDPEPLPCTPMLYATQSHTNSQMNKFLETIADWYKYADNRKKVVGFCAYVIRSSLAKLYAARYRLKSRAKVYGIASRNLSRPLKDSSNNAAPEYSDLLRMGLIEAIEGVQFSHMALIPSCDYTPFPRNWVPDHERVLREYIRLNDPKFFCELHRSVKRQVLTFPQDEISKIVWDFKTRGAWACQTRNNDDLIQLGSFH